LSGFVSRRGRVKYLQKGNGHRVCCIHPTSRWFPLGSPVSSTINIQTISVCPRGPLGRLALIIRVTFSKSVSLPIAHRNSPVLPIMPYLRELFIVRREGGGHGVVTGDVHVLWDSLRSVVDVRKIYTLICHLRVSRIRIYLQA
jgi:hypothetical protein